MEEDKDVLSKLNQILKQQSNLETKIDSLTVKVDEFDLRFTQIEGRVTTNEKSIKENEQSISKNSVSINELGTKFDDVEESCTHISAQYDKLLETANKNTTNFTELDTRVKSLSNENVLLKAQINACRNELLQEKTARNSDAQYQRTSINVKLCGLPLQPGEDIQTPTPSNPVTSALVQRVCEASSISLLSANDIDVCHRLGSQPRSPIIIRFVSKSARYNFFSQRWRLREIDTSKINYDDLPVVVRKERGQDSGRGGHQPRWNLRNSGRNSGAAESAAPPAYGETEDPKPIYMQEHLTKHTKDLLNEAKTKLAELNFEYPGYIKDGEVRAKKNGTDKPILIKSQGDILKIMNKDKDQSD